MDGASSPPPEQEPRILADRPRRIALAVATVAILGLSGVAAFGVAPDTVVDPVPTTLTVRDLPLPPAADDATSAASGPYWSEERVRRGDTIGELLARAGIDDADLLAFVRSDPAARPLYQIKPGQPVRVATAADGRFVELRFAPASSSVLSIRREGDTLSAQRTDAAVHARVAVRSGVIESSLFGAADQVGLPDAITLALADAFSGDIDFYHDIRRGDRFTLVYETLWVDGEPAGAGRILAAEFENRGRLLHAYRWVAPDGTEGYYGPDGSNARKGFLRSPMAFSRVTSGFSLARKHPIFATWRAHKGVDFGAPTGTPIRATANGVVAFAGVEGGYGKAVILRHDGAVTTLYGHMSRFASGIRPGVRVSQGDTIGYVGQTGWATGPHVHYEFRVGNVARNPQTVALPAAEPVPPGQRAAFAASIAQTQAMLAAVRHAPRPSLAATD